MQSSSKLLGKWKFMFKLCKGVNQHANKNGNKSWKFFTFTLHPANVSTVDRSLEMLRSFKCNRRRRRWWADVFEECLEMLRRCSSIIEWEGKINFQHFRWMIFTLEMFTFGSIVDNVGKVCFSLFFFHLAQVIISVILLKISQRCHIAHNGSEKKKSWESLLFAL